MVDFSKIKNATEAEEIKAKETKREETQAWVNAMKDSLAGFCKKNSFAVQEMFQMNMTELRAGFTLLPPDEMTPDELVKFNKEKMPLFVQWQKDNECIVEPVFMTTLSSINVVFVYKRMKEDV